MSTGTGATLAFEDKLWNAADKLRGTMDAAKYKYVVLGLIFLTYIFDSFLEKYADPEDRYEYSAANGNGNGNGTRASREIAVYGQEMSYTTWRLAIMNMAIRGIDAYIRWNQKGSFLQDDHKDLKADFILANPPFNDEDWGFSRVKEDVRWAFGTRPAGRHRL